MSINLEEFKRIERKARQYPKRFYIIYEGEKTEACYVNFLETEYGKDKNIEILPCGNATFCKVENLNKILDEYARENQIPVTSNDEKFYILDLDIFNDNNSKNRKSLEAIVKEYTLLYSRPSFEYWILLHLIDEVKLDTMSLLTKEEIVAEISNYKIMRGKKIKSSKRNELISNISKACSNSKIQHDLIDEHIEYIKGENVNKLLNSSMNLTNMHILFTKIQNHLK